MQALGKIFFADERIDDRMTDTTPPVQEDPLAALMSLFLPIHYRIGVGFEETLRCGQLSRKQVAILWLMRAEGGPDANMRRKDIERLLASWFETSSSTITRSLAALARPPLKLVHGERRAVFVSYDCGGENLYPKTLERHAATGNPRDGAAHAESGRDL
jgi:hypothetical protein